MPYRAIIARHLARQGLVADPGEVEAWMRLAHGDLDHLADWQFAEEVTICVQCTQAAGPEKSRELARSYGLARTEPETEPMNIGPKDRFWLVTEPTPHSTLGDIPGETDLAGFSVAA